MTAHLRSPNLVPPPPQLQAFLAERRFHQDFGTPSPPLSEWPARKIVDYLVIMRELDLRESAASGAPTPPAPPDARAYDRLRSRAGSPPMPPTDRGAPQRP